MYISTNVNFPFIEMRRTLASVTSAGDDV